MTYFAPSNPGLSYSSSDRKRYWGQVSAYTGRPRKRASLTSCRASAADRWTMYIGTPASSESKMALRVASTSVLIGLVTAWYLGSV